MVNARDLWLVMLVMALLNGAMGTLSVGVWRNVLGCEIARKLLHVGMGIVTLFFPLLFRDAWPVLLLCLLTTIEMLVLRHARFLRFLLAGALDGVQRRGWGEFAFIGAVTILFIAARGDTVLYVAPLLLLVLADAAAALCGTRYGRTFYVFAGARKSVEGSLAFGVVALMSTLIVLLMSHIEVQRALPLALAIAAATTLVEAVASRGCDNLLVPLCAFVLLKFSLTQNVPMLWLEAALCMVPTVFCLLVLCRRAYVALRASTKNVVATRAGWR